MNISAYVILFLTTFFMLVVEISSITKQSSNVKEIFPQRLSLLLGRKFNLSINETTYTVAFPDKVQNTNDTVLEENKNVTRVLGRINDTEVVESGPWTLVMYGSGDTYNASEASCSGSRRTHILIYCNVDVHKPELKLLSYNKHWKNDCFYMFELATCAICPTVHDEGLSRGSVFCILFLTAVGVYLVIGICYRRMVVGAKGFEQIPHHKFWTRLGNLQADGCNLVCRRQEEETWQRLTSNAKDTQDDQDDALLRP